MTSSPTPAVLPDARAREVLADARIAAGNLFGDCPEPIAIAAMLAFAKEATPPASDAAVPAGEPSIDPRGVQCFTCGKWVESTSGGHCVTCIRSYRVAADLGTTVPAGEVEHVIASISPHWFATDFNHRQACNAVRKAMLAAAPKVASDTGAITQEWCLRMADLEAGQEIGAGALDHPLRTKCELPPAGWVCTREPGHDGPCAAVASDTGSGLREALARAAVDLQLCPRHNRDGAADRHIQESRDRIRTAMLLATPTDATDGATGGGEDKVTDAHLNATTPGGDLLEQAAIPFAEALEEWGDEPKISDDRDLWEHPLAMFITVGDVRRLARALSTLKPAGDGGEA